MATRYSASNFFSARAPSSNPITGEVYNPSHPVTQYSNAQPVMRREQVPYFVPLANAAGAVQKQGKMQVQQIQQQQLQQQNPYHYQQHPQSQELIYQPPPRSTPSLTPPHFRADPLLTPAPTSLDKAPLRLSPRKRQDAYVPPVIGGAYSQQGQLQSQPTLHPSQQQLQQQTYQPGVILLHTPPPFGTNDVVYAAAQQSTRQQSNQQHQNQQQPPAAGIITPKGAQLMQQQQQQHHFSTPAIVASLPASSSPFPHSTLASSGSASPALLAQLSHLPPYSSVLHSPLSVRSQPASPNGVGGNGYANGNAGNDGGVMISSFDQILSDAQQNPQHAPSVSIHAIQAAAAQLHPQHSGITSQQQSQQPPQQQKRHNESSLSFAHPIDFRDSDIGMSKSYQKKVRERVIKVSQAVQQQQQQQQQKSMEEQQEEKHQLPSGSGNQTPILIRQISPAAVSPPQLQLQQQQQQFQQHQPQHQQPSYNSQTAWNEPSVTIQHITPPTPPQFSQSQVQQQQLQPQQQQYQPYSQQFQQYFEQQPPALSVYDEPDVYASEVQQPQQQLHQYQPQQQQQYYTPQQQQQQHQQQSQYENNGMLAYDQNGNAPASYQQLQQHSQQLQQQLQLQQPQQSSFAHGVPSHRGKTPATSIKDIFSHEPSTTQSATHTRGRQQPQAQVVGYPAQSQAQQQPFHHQAGAHAQPVVTHSTTLHTPWATSSPSPPPVTAVHQPMSNGMLYHQPQQQQHHYQQTQPDHYQQQAPSTPGGRQNSQIEQLQAQLARLQSQLQDIHVQPSGSASVNDGVTNNGSYSNHQQPIQLSSTAPTSSYQSRAPRTLQLPSSTTVANATTDVTSRAPAGRVSSPTALIASPSQLPSSYSIFSPPQATPRFHSAIHVSGESEEIPIMSKLGRVEAKPFIHEDYVEPVLTPQERRYHHVSVSSDSIPTGGALVHTGDAALPVSTPRRRAQGEYNHSTHEKFAHHHASVIPREDEQKVWQETRQRKPVVQKMWKVGEVM